MTLLLLVVISISTALSAPSIIPYAINYAAWIYPNKFSPMIVARCHLAIKKQSKVSAL